MKRFLQELRRRHVYRTFAFYVVAAWVIIQVVTAIFEAFEIDKGLLRFLWIAFAAGSPLALIFSWIYDITPEGIVHTPPREADEEVDLSLHGVDYFLIGAFLIIMVTIGYGVIYTSEIEIEDWLKSPNLAIAVLPLRDVSIEGDLENFGYAVSEAVLSNLGHINELDVIASGSSFRFQRASALPEIRHQLNVDYVVEGSINRNDSQVVVTARLIDASNGRQEWSHTYESGPDQPFEAQMHIAMQIADHLGMTLGDPYRYGATTNFDAYNALIKYFETNDPLFIDEALRLDPDFVWAMQYKAWGHFMRMRGDLTAVQAWELARPLLDRALEVTDEEPVTYALIGEFRFRLHDYDGALEALERALEISPSDTFALESLSRVYTSIGRHDESVALARRDVRLNPLSATAHTRLANRLWQRDDLSPPMKREALVHYERSVVLGPGSFGSWHDYVWSVARLNGEGAADAFRLIGRMQKEPLIVDKVGPKFLAPNFIAAMARWFVFIDDPEMAERLLKVVEATDAWTRIHGTVASLHMARREYAQAYDRAWKAMEGNPKDSFQMRTVVLAGIGSGADHDRIIAHVAANWPELLQETPSISAPTYGLAIYLARLFQVSGETAQSAALLEALDGYATANSSHWVLRARVLALTDRSDEAMTLLREHVDDQHWITYRDV
jgi:TolB-like protein